MLDHDGTVASVASLQEWSTIHLTGVVNQIKTKRAHFSYWNFYSPKRCETACRHGSLSFLVYVCMCVWFVTRYTAQHRRGTPVAMTNSPLRRMRITDKLRWLVSCVGVGRMVLRAQQSVGFRSGKLPAWCLSLGSVFCWWLTMARVWQRQILEFECRIP